MKRKIETSIDIAASAPAVWKILTEFGLYGDWNPFITNVSGSVREGTRITVSIKPPGKTEMTFKPLVLTVTPERHITWLGHFLTPGLLDGQHDFRIEDRMAGCRFHQSEQFSGILVRLFGGTFLGATKAGFDLMNIALKERTESAAL